MRMNEFCNSLVVVIYVYIKREMKFLQSIDLCFKQHL